MPPRTVLFIVFDGVQSLDVTGPLEVFAHARDGEGAREGWGEPARGEAAHGEPAAYRIVVAGPGGVPVRSSAGLTLVPDTDLAAAPAEPGWAGGWTGWARDRTGWAGNRTGWAGSRTGSLRPGGTPQPERRVSLAP
ncbi:MAG TPA: hypothetical protein VHY31_04965 [Streptosporangiaceae bacterium]|nr:hypothetical protein [Streptosporangiaceae bacterium]